MTPTQPNPPSSAAAYRATAKMLARIAVGDLDADSLAQIVVEEYAPLVQAAEAMLENWNPPGCPDKTCSVCQKNKAIVDALRASLASTKGGGGA